MFKGTLPGGAGMKEHSRRNRSIAGVLTELKDSTETVDVLFDRRCRRLNDRWTESKTKRMTDQVLMTQPQPCKAYLGLVICPGSISKHFMSDSLLGRRTRYRFIQGSIYRAEMIRQ